MNNMDAKVVSAALELGMSILPGSQDNMYIVYNFKRTEGVTVFYDRLSGNYVVKHLIHLPDGRTAAFSEPVPTDPDEAIKRMKEFNAERLQFEKDNRIDTINKDNISKITSYTEKLLEDVLCKWDGPGCATDTIGQMRCTVANAIRESLEANRSVIHNMYNL
jgi:hypothetical protein